MSHMQERTGEYNYVNTEITSKMPFSIDMAGLDKCTQRYFLKRNNSPISVIGFTVSGCGIIKQNGKEVKAEKGSLFIVNIGDDHEYRSLKNWQFYWVNICGNFFKELLVNYKLQNDVLFEKFELGGEFMELIKKSNDKGTDFGLWQTDMQAFLFKAVLSLYRAKTSQAKETMGSRIKKEIEKHVAEGLSEKEICRLLGISLRQAQRIFKEEFSLTIHKFITETKMRRARALLMNTKSSIKQIALETGFENEKYFSTFFKREEGVSPALYRKRVLEAK